MKIAFASDLHLEFGSNPKLLADADVLVLAGDIFVAGKESTHKPFVGLLSECKAHYKEVLYLAGNHEHYHGDFLKTESVICELLPDGVKLLSNTFFDIDGVRFLGATLWTDCKNKDEAVMAGMRFGMNDYHIVKNITPELTADEHFKTVEFLKANTLPGSVICSHHAPAYESVAYKYRAENLLNHAYYTDLSGLMKSNRPALWIHGHTHETFDYMVDETRVVCNPHGYEGRERRADQFQIRVVEI